jgi:hypothetical protein
VDLDGDWSSGCGPVVRSDYQTIQEITVCSRPACGKRNIHANNLKGVSL